MVNSIDKSTLAFLKDLGRHNNREWFASHKDEYLRAHDNMIAFCNSLLSEMRKHDNIENSSAKDCLYRIYRDTRFSKDKTPYKNHFAGGFQRATKLLRGGYYFEIGPGKSYAGGGFYAPNKEDLLRIRHDIEINFNEWKKILRNKSLIKTFGEIQGEKLITAPRGFNPEDPAIALLRHKNFYFVREFSDQEVLDPSFMKTMNNTFKNLRPYFDYMSEVLTTDLNGEPLF
jgi:uncharacterized protein (TIGR02453 family)